MRVRRIAVRLILLTVALLSTGAFGYPQDGWKREQARAARERNRERQQVRREYHAAMRDWHRQRLNANREWNRARREWRHDRWGLRNYGGRTGDREYHF